MTRQILIASQKGGVGKTTTAINLAFAAAFGGRRVLLLDADPLSSVSAALGLESDRGAPGLPGFSAVGEFWPEVEPRLHVSWPFPRDGAPDPRREFESVAEAIRRAMESPAFDLVVIDAPPLKGDFARDLVGLANEILIVLRAEPLALRTLPPFLEALASATRPGARRIHGLMLTMPPDQDAGQRWETALRTQYGEYVLRASIPFDWAVGQALLESRPVLMTSPGSPSAARYRALAVELGLADSEADIRVPEYAAASVAASAPKPPPTAGNPPFEDPVEAGPSRAPTPIPSSSGAGPRLTPVPFISFPAAPEPLAVSAPPPAPVAASPSASTPSAPGSSAGFSTPTVPAPTPPPGSNPVGAAGFPAAAAVSGSGEEALPTMIGERAQPWLPIWGWVALATLAGAAVGMFW